MAVLIPSDCHRLSTPAEIPPLPTSVIRRRPAGLAARFFLCALLIWLAPSALRAQTKEYQVKAAFLFNFAQFVSWPETAFTNADEPFQIGVLGENPFSGDLNETIRGEAIHGHKMVIMESRQVENLAGCQIIFISKSEAAHADEVFTKLGSRPVLTISEVSGFARRGGVINFYRDGSKVRFEINPDAAEKNGLKLSSELLSVGKIIHSEAAPK
jgi:YfiR/HmsC-like